jgi:hypothetical protein
MQKKITMNEDARITCQQVPNDKQANMNKLFLANHHVILLFLLNSQNAKIPPL